MTPFKKIILISVIAVACLSPTGADAASKRSGEQLAALKIRSMDEVEKPISSKTFEENIGRFRKSREALEKDSSDFEKKRQALLGLVASYESHTALLLDRIAVVYAIDEGLEREVLAELSSEKKILAVLRTELSIARTREDLSSLARALKSYRSDKAQNRSRRLMLKVYLGAYRLYLDGISERAHTLATDTPQGKEAERQELSLVLDEIGRTLSALNSLSQDIEKETLSHNELVKVRVRLTVIEGNSTQINKNLDKIAESPKSR